MPAPARRTGLRRAAIPLAILAAFAFALTAGAQAPDPARTGNQLVPPAGSNIVPGQYLVKLSAPASGLTAATTRAASAAGLEVRRVIPRIGWVIMGEPRGAAVRPTAEVVARLGRDADVTFVEPDRFAYATGVFNVNRRAGTEPGALTSNDPLIWQQWGHYATNTTDAWEVTSGDSGVVIAILDTGIDATHEDHSGVVLGWDFIENDSVPQDENGHGTHVAGTAGARRDNNAGGSGTCPQCTILAVRVLDASGSGTLGQVASGIVWAAEAANGNADVISMSLSASSGAQALEDAVNFAWAQGVVVVAAAGNTGSSGVQFPAAYANVIAVAALTPAGMRASFSTTGAEVEIAAPGSSVLSTVPSGSCELCTASGYLWLDGASMATPHVSGIAGLIISSESLLSAADVRSRLTATAIPNGEPATAVGSGAVNACAAITGCAPFEDYVEVQIDHTWFGDLAIELEPPAGAPIELFNRNPSGFGSDENDIDMRYPLIGAFAPDAGTWTLTAQDFATARGNDPEVTGVGDIVGFRVRIGGTLDAASGLPLAIPDAERQGQTVVVGDAVSATVVTGPLISIAITGIGGGAPALDFGTVSLGATVATASGDISVENTGSGDVNLTVEYVAPSAGCGVSVADWDAVPATATPGIDEYSMSARAGGAGAFVGVPVSGAASIGGLAAASSTSLDVQLIMPSATSFDGPCTTDIVITALASP